MSAIPTHPTTLRHVRTRASRDFPTTTPPELKVSILGFRPPNRPVFSRKFDELRGPIAALNAPSQEGSVQELDDSPVSVELGPISGETQFDQVAAEAQQLGESFVVVWMASWCRKCIYLKPKLEKLAAEYYPRVRFYRIDVNSVPYKLVARAEVTYKMGFHLYFRDHGSYNHENANYTALERRQETS